MRQGRNGYVRISDPRVAGPLERLTEHAHHRQPCGLRSSLRARRLALARTCYDHLAGTLGVALREGMLRQRLSDTTDGLPVTCRGRAVLDEIEVTWPAGRRPLLRECLDWTERVEHLAGALLAAILRRALDAGWVSRDPHRAVDLHAAAAASLALLGVDVTSL